MAMTNYERLKRWREKHPVLAKRRRAEAYKRSKGQPVSVPAPVEMPEVAAAPKSRIDELRDLMAAAGAEPVQPVEVAPAKPRVFRNDFGAVISEAAWNELQKRKADAADGGYVIDEFSQ